MAGLQSEVTLWTCIMSTSSLGTSRSTVRATEASATTASTATVKETEGRKESSRSILRSLRIELKAVGVNLVSLLVHGQAT